MATISLNQTGGTEPRRSLLQLFGWTLIPVTLSCLSYWGYAFGGAKPLDGTSLFFLGAVLFFIAASVITLLVGVVVAFQEKIISVNIHSMTRWAKTSI